MKRPLNKKIIFGFIILLTLTSAFGALPRVLPTTVVHAQEPTGSDSLTAIPGQVGGNGETAKSTQGTKLTFWDVLTGTNPIAVVQDWILRFLGLTLLTISRFVLYLAGKVLDGSMYLTVHMKDILDNVPIVDIGWGVFRDFANMVFIFVLLYIAIATILNIGNTKQMLTTAIITALLINFSLFITKAVVDVSNIFALQFYNKIVTIGDNDPDEGYPGPAKALAIALKAETVNADKLAVDQTDGYDAYISEHGQQVANPYPVFIENALSSVVLVVAAFMFVVGAFLLFLRIITLMFLMILSPLAFVARILPGTQWSWNKWWHALINNAMFAPAFLGLLYMVLLTTQNGLSIVNKGTLAGAFSGAASSLGVLLNYVFVLMLFGGCIFVAKSLSVVGASTADRWASSAKNWVRTKATRTAGLPFRVAGQAGGFALRQTVGRAGAALDDQIKKTAFGQSVLGSRLREATTGAAAKAKFGSKSFEGVKKERGEELKQYLDKAGSDPAKLHDMMERGGGIVGMTGTDKELLYKNMSDRQKVLYEEEARRRGSAGLLRDLSGYKGKLNRDQQEKLEESYLREFRDNPRKLASHFDAELNSSPELRTHAFDKLSPGDRAAMLREMSALPPVIGRPPLLHPRTGAPITHPEWLKESLSPDEREKTEEAIRKDAIEVKNREKITDTERIASGAVNPATSAAYTPTEIDAIIAQLRPDQTRNLSNQARKHPDVIRRFTQRHLNDLQRNGNLLPDEANEIINQITGPIAYPNKAAQLNYVNANAALWGL